MDHLKTISLAGILMLTLLLACTQKIEYPETKMVDVVDNYHGTEVADPYRWLEDDNAEETKAWVESQNEVTFAYLEKIPQREKIKNRLTEIYNYEKVWLPYHQGGIYVYERNDGLQNQDVLYMRKTMESQPQVLLDPNTLSEDGTISLTTYSVSPNGKYLAYAVSSGGSDWREARVREIATGADLDDKVQWIKFSDLSWSGDSQGFYYSRFPAPEEDKALVQQNKFQKLYFHRVGTTQNEDVLVYEDKKHPFRGCYAEVSDDGRYLVMTITKGTDERNRVYYTKIGLNKKGRVHRLLDDFDAGYHFIGNKGTLFFFRTDLEAPRSRVIEIDLNHPERKNWETVIPQQTDVLSSAYLINSQLVTIYMHDAHDVIRVYNNNGSFDTEIPLPTLGSIRKLDGKAKGNEIFFVFASFSYPNTIYRYDFTTKETSVFHQPNVSFNPEDFETKQVFYTSKDGTKVPLFISYKKGMVQNGKNPTYLYGYGGFNISKQPSFKERNLMWMEMGGIYAQAILRGGGEYGMAWYDAGRLKNKQNVFDDFISAAEYLIAEKYTSKKKLAIGGGSNGGLLVGACMTQRPDLFQATLPAVGVMDMLRYHTFTVGRG